MKTNNFALHQGKIVYVPEVPLHVWSDHPDPNKSGFYQKALQSAIASGIEVENQDEVLDQLWRHDERINSPIPFLYWKENMLPRAKDMPYPLQCRVEIRELWGFPESVARVTFEQNKTAEEMFKHKVAERAAQIVNANRRESMPCETDEQVKMLYGEWVTADMFDPSPEIDAAFEIHQQQTASLQKQVEVLTKERNEVLRCMHDELTKKDDFVKKAAADYIQLQAENERLKKELRNWLNYGESTVQREATIKALNPQDSQK